MTSFPFSYFFVIVDIITIIFVVIISSSKLPGNSIQTHIRHLPSLRAITRNTMKSTRWRACVECPLFSRWWQLSVPRKKEKRDGISWYDINYMLHVFVLAFLNQSTTSVLWNLRGNCIPQNFLFVFFPSHFYIMTTKDNKCNEYFFLF